MLHTLVLCGAILVGTLSGWEEDLRDTPDKALANDVVADVMKKLADATGGA